MDYAAIIKERVSTPELFSFYGFKRNRGGFINCPFHEEKTGSMKVYDGTGGYHCFGGCGAHNPQDYFNGCECFDLIEVRNVLQEEFAKEIVPMIAGGYHAIIFPER